MNTKVIEATNGLNWGRFLVGRLDVEWGVRSEVDRRDGIARRGYEEWNPGLPVLTTCGTNPDALWVLDLVTREGASFKPGGLPAADLKKHQIWVCPLFEPFLEWLYQQDLGDLDKLPALVELPAAPFEFHGYRRPGTKVDGEDR